MIIENFKLKNFRCFNDIDIELHPQVNVIVGINGTGKTALLEALRIFVGAIFCELDKVENKIVTPSILDDDVRLHNLERQYPVKIDGKISFDYEIIAEQSVTWDRVLERFGGKTKFGNGKSAKILSKQIQQCIRNGSDSSLPIIAFYSTDRYKKDKRIAGIEAEGSRLRGYFNSLDSTTNILFFLNIIKTETYWEIQNQNKKQSQILLMLRKVISLCVADCKDMVYDVKRDKLIITLQNGEKVPFSSLSDGVRNVLSMVIELALRCYLLNPKLGKDAPAKTHGVVLIDEIDLHLHPEWQLHILNDLCKVFERIQFIVSTHAPIVLSSLHVGKILSIADKTVYDFPNQFSHSVDYILKEMSPDLGNVEIEKTLANYRLLIEKGRGMSDEAKKMRKKLVAVLGENHEELQRTDIMLQLFQ